MLADSITEVIFVGLPGPSHHYGGLSNDNVASTLNRGSVSNPRAAALQALELVRLLLGLGIKVALLPPLLRPHMALLRQHFSGDDNDIIRQTALSAPALLDKASSSSAMWVANAATVTPVVDCNDHKLHIAAANLFTNLHRRIEADDTWRLLKEIFATAPDSVVHPPLSAAMGLRDEGAANHMRLSPSHSEPGLNVFVYGADGSAHDPESARQTLSASRAVRLQHKIPDAGSMFIRQNPEAINAGVFHNDVIAVSNENVLLVHAEAYEDKDNDIGRIDEAYRELYPGHEPVIIVIENEDMTVEEAVKTYFFNSQIITRPDGGMTMIAPAEVRLLYEGRGAELMERICNDTGNPIDQVHYIDLRQSMRNGGGPACLRLRVPVTQAQLQAVSSHSGVTMDERRLEEIGQVISRHYPDSLTPDDLGNPALYQCSRDVQEALAGIMRLA